MTIEPSIECPRCNGTGVTFLARILGRKTQCSCPAGQQIAGEAVRSRGKMAEHVASFASGPSAAR